MFWLLVVFVLLLLLLWFCKQEQKNKLSNINNVHALVAGCVRVFLQTRTKEQVLLHINKFSMLGNI
jgi:hypothetical protein